MTKVPYFSIEFKKADENAKIYDIIKYVNSKILGPDSGDSALLQTKEKGIIDLFHWLQGNMAEIDKSDTERIFKTEMPILQQDEHVEKAFQVGGDRTLLTNKRIVRVDMALFIGKTISYDFVPWKAVQAFQVHSAGYLDSSSEMTIWTSVPFAAASLSAGYPEPPRVFQQNLRSFSEGTPDVVEVQSLFAKYVLGDNTRERVLPATPISKYGGIPGGRYQTTGSEIMSFLLGNFSTAHPGQAEGRLRAMAPILQENEHVEMAFQKNRFENDIIYLTTKRVIFADIKKWLAWDNAIEYLSIPYDSIHLFKTETAATFDLDCMFTMYTGIHPPPPFRVFDNPDQAPGGASGASKDPNEGNDFNEDFSEPRPSPAPSPSHDADDNDKTEDKKTKDGKKYKLVAKPGMSMIEVSLRTGTDINAIQKLLYTKVLRTDGYEGSFLEQEKSAPASKNGGVMDFIHWLDGNAKEFSPEEAERQLHVAGPILVGPEKVLKAFTTWRDLTLLTSTRLLVVDIQSVAVFRRIVYTTVPYENIHGFGIESAGTFDLDATMMFYTTSPWMPHVQQDLARGTSNIAELQTFLCDRLVPSGTKGAALLETDSVEPSQGSFLNWLGNNHDKMDTQTAEAQLRFEKVLQVGETVKLAYRVGYDKMVYTNRRILQIDVNDWDLFTRKVEYRTIPYTSVIGFSVQSSHGYLDWDEEVIIYTNMHDFQTFEQDIASGGKDIYHVQMQLAENSLA